MTLESSKTRFTKAERALLRELAAEAWNAELHEALMGLYEEFAKWGDDAMSSLELSDKIHEFHDGIARELYARYTTLNAGILVSRAVALGLLNEDALGKTLFEKLAPEIGFFRERNQ